MTAQTDLWTVYPDRAGYTEPTTARDAADAIEGSGRAERLRLRVLAWFQAGHRGTADDCASALGESVLSIRPRVTECYRQGYLTRTGQRRRNATGGMANVLRLTP